MDPVDDRATIFAENEARLKSFYNSAESETTQNYEFMDIHRPITINDVGRRGSGLSLKERAVPGQLLIVSNALASCACNSECAPYEEDSYVHAPKAVWLPPRIRIPPDVHRLLVTKLAHICTVDEDDREQILKLDSRDPNSSHGSGNPSMGDESGTSSSHGSNTDDLGWQLWNIVANNAMCTKVRGLSQDGPSRVETCDFWGVWLLPSYINHSCAPNCHRMVVGEAMLIRSATNIAAGDELTLPYFDIFEPLYVRDANCQSFGFRCECRRCMFERSIGKPYNDIQTQILMLKFKMQNEWKINGAGVGGKATVLLQQLADQIIPVNQIIVKMYSHLAESLNEKLDNLGKTQNPIEESWEFLKELGLDNTSIEESWIQASFIDAMIALYVVHVTMHENFSGLGENSFDLLLTPSGSASEDELEEDKRKRRAIVIVREILDTINQVHPGNMLGQEFYSIIVTGLRRILESDSRKNVDYCRSQLQCLESNGMRFYSSYYGYPGASVLNLLLATKS